MKFEAHKNWIGSENQKAMKRLSINPTSLSKGDYDYQTKEVATTKISYWTSLPFNEQDGYLASAAGGYANSTAKEEYIMAIDAAWEDSPIRREDRRLKQEAYDNELLTCKRTGEQVARKYSLIVGNSTYAFTSLTEAERDLFNIELPEIKSEDDTSESKAVVEADKEKATNKKESSWESAKHYIETGRRYGRKY